MLKRATNTALNLILPPRCISCSSVVGEVGALCSSCWSEIDFITSPLCVTCGFPLEPDAGKDSICGHCIAEEPKYDIGRSVFCYDEHSKSLITGFKYSDKLHAVRRFSAWMVRAAGDEITRQAELIVPVPLHWRRLFARRYNQSALLAKAISSQTGIKCEMQALMRKKNTPPQASLTRKERFKNIKGAFALNPGLKGLIKDKTILLIDDVTTTGATLNECAKILKKGGADKVFVLTLARIVEGR